MNRLLRTSLAALSVALIGCGLLQGALAQEVVIPKQPTDATVDSPPAAVGEYQDGGTISNGLGSFEAMSFRDPSTGSESIQFYFDINDGSASASDEIRVLFDTDHDENASPATLDRGILIQRPAGSDPGSADITEVNPFGTPTVLGSVPAGQWSVESTGSGWTVEVKLKAADLDLNRISSLMGLHVTVTNSATATPGLFPAGVNQANVAGWADLKTRYPLDFVLVLDQSGSMLSQEKWENAKRSADIFANLMAILGEPVHFDDRLGLVAFNWPCGGSSDGTSMVKPLASLGAFPVGSYTGSSPPVSDPESNFCTPIGEGLAEAFTNLDAPLPDDDPGVERMRGALLLSDGLQNRPTTSFSPSDTGYDPCPSVSNFDPCPPSTISNVSVATVAFGEGDWAVDTDRLSEIQGRYLGSFATTYSMATPGDVEDLKQTFIQGLEDIYSAELLHAGSVTSFSVASGNEKLILIASWTDPLDAEPIGAEREGSSVSCDAQDEDQNVGFAACAVDVPEGGTWEAVPDDGTFDETPARLFVVVDLRVSARFEIDRGRHGTGQPILLTARLRDRGEPVLHDPAAHPVQVTVDVETPETGVGTFASTHEPAACTTVEPRLPDPGQVRRDTVIMTRALPTAGAVARGRADPDPPLYALMSRLLSSCAEQGILEAGGLSRDMRSNLQLFDDGTHGDEVANDGIYTLRYEDTEVAGTYVFNFEARGSTADGQSFTRTKRIAEYVRVDVSSEDSETGSRIVDEDGDMVVREYFVLPRDRFGGYLGPGKTQQVEFVHEGGAGSFTSDVIDQGNGYYSRRIEYNETQGRPDVTPVVQGKPIEPQPGGIPGAELGFYADGYSFDNTLDLDAGYGFGGWFGLPLWNSPLYAEGEFGMTRTNITESDTVRVIQGLANLRYDVRLGGRLVPHVTAGAGFMRFLGEGDDETVFAYHGGAGLSWYFSPNVGLRANGRFFRINEVRGSGGPTTNLQVYIGIVLRR